jgi:ADP-ribose pyrophosphatase YjhB (NUDIX family)
MASTEHFTTRLPTKRVAADCLIFDRDDRFLIVEPTYKSTWDVPGGVCEIDESPRRAARRELSEELGLELEPGALLAVDWVSRDGAWTEVVAFLFDGGVVDLPVDSFTLQTEEIRTARFVTPAEAEPLMAADELARVEAAITARSRRSAVYLEDGSGPTEDDFGTGRRTTRQDPC